MSRLPRRVVLALAIAVVWAGGAPALSGAQARAPGISAVKASGPGGVCKHRLPGH